MAAALAADGSQAEQSKRALNTYVKQSLTSNGTQEYYNRLLESVQSLKSDSEERSRQQLVNLIHAVSSNVSLLHPQRHRVLLAELLEHRLWHHPPDVRHATLELICHLAVAQGAMTHGCIEVLCASIVPPPAPPTPEQLAAVGQQWAIDPHVAAVQSQVVEALTQLLTLVPTAASRIASALVRGFPHKLRDRDAQCTYLHGMFMLAEGAAGAPVRDVLLAGVVDHMLTIDVEIKWEDIVDPCADAAAEEGSSSDDEVFELEDMTLGLQLSEVTPTHREGWEGGGAVAHAAPPEDGQAAPVDVTADKLDAMMDLVMTHLRTRCEAGQVAQVWAALQDAFERSVLQVHRSKFVQFLVFHVTAAYPAHCVPPLLQLLLQRLTDARQAAITRSACAAYIASFLARAAFVPHSTLLEALQRLTTWTSRYAASAGMGRLGDSPSFAAPSTTRSMSDMQQAMQLSRARSTGQMGGDAGAMAARHQVFYAAVQAAMYVLCYHMRALLASKEAPRAGVVALLRQLHEVLGSALAPLHFCADSVVAEYTHQCRALGMPLPPDAPAGTALRERRPLELFFPFDPYLLRRSAQHMRLRETYVRWSRGHSTAGRGEGPLGRDAAVQGNQVLAEESASEEEETASLLQDSSEEEEEEDVVGSSLEMAMSPPMPSRGALRMLAPHPSLTYPAGTQPRPIPADSGDMAEEPEGMSASPYGKSIPMLSCSMASGQRVPMTTLNTS